MLFWNSAFCNSRYASSDIQLPIADFWRNCSTTGTIPSGTECAMFVGLESVARRVNARMHSVKPSQWFSLRRCRKSVVTRSFTVFCWWEGNFRTEQAAAKLEIVTRASNVNSRSPSIFRIALNVWNVCQVTLVACSYFNYNFGCAVWNSLTTNNHC